MATYATEAICIYKAPFGETSQVVHYMTQDLGRVACLIKGAFREKNRYQGNEDLLNMSRITLSFRGEGGLGLLRERVLLGIFPGLRKRIGRFAAASTVLDAVRWSVQERQDLPGLYLLFKNTLLALEMCGSDRDIILFTFFNGMLSILGFRPALSSCTGCGRVPVNVKTLYVSPRHGGIICRNCRQDMSQGMTISPEAVEWLKKTTGNNPLEMRGQDLQESMSQELLVFFELFLTGFLEKKLNSLDFLKEFTNPLRERQM